MIATEVINAGLTRDGAPLYLAPYDETELAAAWPTSVDDLLFPPADLELLTEHTPEEVAALTREREYLISWGVYTSEVSPERFLGTISLTEHLLDEGDHTPIVQEVGTFLMRPEARGKGLGTLAKVAVAGYAFGSQGTKLIESYTSVNNKAAQKSLHRAGFIRQSTFDYLDFPGGGQTEYWLLSHADIHAAVADNHELPLSDLEAGWERYQAIAQNLG